MLKVRSFLLTVFALCLGIYICCGYWLEFALERFRCRRPGLSGGPRRSCVARLQSKWSARAFRIIVKVFRIELKLENLVGFMGYEFSDSLLVISNHQSMMDIVLLYYYLQELGIANVRWVLKKALEKVPIIGQSCVDSGSAFVRRAAESGTRDIKALVKCAQYVKEDSACIVLFPEGTRFTEPRADSELLNVLPPHAGGFYTLVRKLDCPVLSVTLQWLPKDSLVASRRTIWGIGNFWRKKLVVRSRIVRQSEVRSCSDWLGKEWRNKDWELRRELA